jgi:hypothetical protein
VEKTTYGGASCSVILTKYCSGDQIKKTELGRACSTYEKRGAYRLMMGNLREEGHLKDQGVDGRIILKLILEKWNGGHRLDRSGSGQGQVLDCCE